MSAELLGLIGIFTAIAALLAALWPYFHEGRKPPRGKRRRARIFAMARILANVANGLASEKIRADFDGHWDKYYQHIYEKSPALQEFWKDQGKFWPEETRRRFVSRPNRAGHGLSCALSGDIHRQRHTIMGHVQNVLTVFAERLRGAGDEAAREMTEYTDTG